MIRSDQTPKACLKSAFYVFVAFALMFALGLEKASAEQRVVIATTGGTYEKALREAWFEPFTKATGIKVVTVSGTDAEKRAKVTAMVQTGNVTWDLYLDGEIQAGSDAHFAITEDLSDFCMQFINSTDLLADSCTRGGAKLQSTSTLLAYKLNENGSNPQTWADMWDLAKFPGARSFPNFDDPWRVLAAALLADGVPREKLFPLDVDRAFRKLACLALRPYTSLAASPRSRVRNMTVAKSDVPLGNSLPDRATRHEHRRSCPGKWPQYWPRGLEHCRELISSASWSWFALGRR